MDIRDILLICAFVADLFLALIVVKANRRKESNITYGLVAILVGLWSLGIAGFRASTNYEIQLFWNREFILAAALIGSSFFHFSIVFSDTKIKINNWIRILIYLPNLLIIWAIFTPGVLIQDIKIRVWGNESILGWGYIYYGIYFSFLWILSSYNLIKKYIRSKGIFRAQLRYILIGTIFSMLFGSIFDLFFILFGNYKWIWLGPYSSFTFVLFSTYAIVRYRLMDIRIVARKTFIYFGVALFSYIAYNLIILGYTKYFGSVYDANTMIVGIAIAPIFVAGFYLVDKLLTNVANKYFFSGLYNYQLTITNLSRELSHFNDLNKIVDLIVETIKSTMRLNRAGVLLIDQAQTPVLYRIAKVIGFNEKNGISLVKDNFLTQYLQKTQKPLVLEELDMLARDAKKEVDKNNFVQLHDNMVKIEASLCLPILGSQKLIGIIVLGGKISGDAYLKEDLDLLSTLSFQAGIAIENARLFSEVKDFNKTLKQKVDEQTKDLRQQAEHLKKLLAMRSEFLDIASHQLKTPVSVILGTASMFREGTMDKLPKEQQQKFMDNIFFKAKKLGTIINDILRASEMDTENFQLLPGSLKSIQVETIGQSLIEDFENEAKEKGVEFKVVSPKQKLAPVLADHDFLEQAIYNLVDNAIKYTKQGSVTLSFIDAEQNINIEVKDTGVGIPEVDKTKLFGKFNRAANAVDMYTDGSGLGLFIVKKIVEAHPGGKISFTSQEGQGTTFIITLPKIKK